MLVDLDYDCARHILTEWLNLASVPKIDSAFCSWSTRHLFLELLRRNGIPFENKWDEWICQPEQGVQVYQWIARRGVGMKSLPMVALNRKRSVKMKAFQQVIQECKALVNKLQIGRELKVYQRYLSSRIVALYGQSFLNVEEFSLRASSRISYSSSLPCTLAKYYPNLRRVYLAEALVDSSALVRMVELCTHLTHIDVGVTDGNCVPSIAENCPHLQALQIRGCWVPGTAIATIVQHCPDLHTLRVRCAQGMETALTQIATCSINLQSIDLYEWFPFPTHALVQFLAGRRLQHLSINLHGRPEHDILAVLGAVVYRSAQISSLRVRCNLMDACLMSTVQRMCNLSNLTLDCIYRCNIPLNAWTAAWASVPLLRKLTLQHCTSFDDAALQSLVQDCTLLQELQLVSADVHDIGLRYLGQHARYLRSLRLWNVHVTMPALWAMAEECRSLRYIEMTLPVCNPQKDSKRFPARVHANLEKL